MATEARTYAYLSSEENELAGVLGLTPHVIHVRVGYSRGGHSLSYHFPGGKWAPWPGLRGKRTPAGAEETWAAVEHLTHIGERI